MGEFECGLGFTFKFLGNHLALLSDTAYPRATARARPRPAPDTESQWPGPSCPVRDWLCVPRPSTPPRSASSRVWLSSPTSPRIGCEPRPRPESSRDWLRAPRPSSSPSPPRPARRRLSGLFGRCRSPASLSAGMAWADAPLLCSGFRAGHACGDRNPTPADLELRSSSLTTAEVQLPQSLGQVDNYRYKPLKLECPVAGISVDLSQLSLPLQ
ncbi:PREDICTED: putative uncharacterized protein DANCR [Rhinopithecus bieti]|uniref:putative uncharacterized protein DANCR n=1 Tax=Rhinopithecus bieti TaxID=61621 RepID=UPI00083C7924|nr:PREDICTED: putative uncharacterized protein DANCR [Rhinopithecus bieti]